MSNPQTAKRKRSRHWTPSWQMFGSIAYGQETLWSCYIPFTRIQVWIMRKRNDL